MTVIKSDMDLKRFFHFLGVFLKSKISAVIGFFSLNNALNISNFKGIDRVKARIINIEQLHPV